MKKLLLMAVYVGLALNGFVVTLANDDTPVCTDIGQLMYGNQQQCKKGDVIMVNPMMAAFLCDLSKPSIAGEKTVVCHYLGKKRPVREKKK